MALAVQLIQLSIQTLLVAFIAGTSFPAAAILLLIAPSRGLGFPLLVVGGAVGVLVGWRRVRAGRQRQVSPRD